MKKVFKKKYLLIIIVVLILGTIVLYIKARGKSLKVEPEITFTQPVNQNTNDEPLLQSNINSPDTNQNTDTTDTPSTNVVSSEPKTTSSVLIKMPFLVQAPFANWDALHEDACEESSLIMVYHYYNKTKIDSSQQGEDEIQKIIEYETKNGYGQSITLSELAIIARKYYNMNSSRIVNASKETIITELNNGKPVIVPAAGKLLDNPNFKNGGPNYHMLVIKGYDKNGFITNDPGTRKGEGFRYTYENLLNAIHDWDPVNIQNGEKYILVFD